MDQDLDFALLDDILPVSPELIAESGAQIRSARPHFIGPLTEYVCHAASEPSLPAITELLGCAEVQELQRVFSLRNFDRMPFSASHQARGVEFHWGPPRPEDFSAPAWMMFLRRMQNAAERAGFQRKVPAGLTGAFGEMADNAHRHSLQPLTAICGYRWADGCFEYVVADAGQGVLASLRSCSEYAHLQDSGDALQVALTEGESRFGRGSGHGRGFRELFCSLADLSGRLRFRSGDHALTIDGTNPDLSHARLFQLGANYSGFVVSVSCSPS
jgi:hypothetical protein